MKKSIAFINPRVSTNNVGDYFIEDSVKKIVDYDPANSIDIDPRKPLSVKDIENINKCDAAIIVGTNLWYRHISKENRWMISTDDLKKIKVPFIPFGVGATLHRGEIGEFDKESVSLLQQIHGQCVEASVRDPRTFEMVKKAGIDNVRMTGCPTLYRSLKRNWELQRVESNDVVVTTRKGQDTNFKIIMNELRKRKKNPIIAAQKKTDLFCGRRRFPFFTAGPEVLYDFKIEPYQKLVQNTYGAIGWRLHGNMLHLAHGKPTVFFANCSRILSFCEAFSLPCIYAEDGESIAKSDLIQAVGHLMAADIFSAFPARYSEFFLEMVKFFERNGIAHNLVY
ncbi:MAG: polysaccharide pyruvyl transferase family protein [Deltaproteobacteria bacterium]|nr:polysaccharide pyruvyl transferase family protein [Deltaproteobacteria bacterium]